MPSASADNGSHPTCVWSRALAPLLHLKENEAQNAVRQSSDRFWRTMLSWSERDIVIQDVADAQEDTDNDGGDDVGLRISSRHVSMDDGSAIFIAGEQLHEEDRLSEIGDTGDGHEDAKLSVSVVGNRSVLAHLRHGSVRSPWFNMLPSSRLRFVWRAYTCASCRATSKVGRHRTLLACSRNREISRQHDPNQKQALSGYKRNLRERVTFINKVSHGPLQNQACGSRLGSLHCDSANLPNQSMIALMFARPAMCSMYPIWLRPLLSGRRTNVRFWNAAPTRGAVTRRGLMPLCTRARLAIGPWQSCRTPRRV